MRKLLLSLRSTLLVFLLVGTSQIATGNFQRYDYFFHGGIKYRITGDGTASVASSYYSDYQGDIVMPSRVTTSVWNYNEDYGLSYVITSIDKDAFKNCIGLTSIELPNTVTGIGDNAFYGCSGLSSITLSNGLESIGQSAFGNCTSLQSITIPNSVSSMGWNVFYGCSDLKNVTLSNHLRELNGTFVGCSSLESIKIPTSVVSLNGSFTNCTSLNTVAIPYSVSIIGDNAFMGCSGLVSVNIPNSVSQIGKLAFGNTALTVVDIPNTVTSVGQDAFTGCNQLTTVISRAVEPPTMSNKNTFEAWVYENAKLKVPLIAESTYRERNWWNLFNDISGNESLNNNYDFVIDGIYYHKVDGNSVEVTYKDNNYNSYSGIVNVPASVTSGGKTYSVIGVGNYAFYNCSSLTGVSLPATITTIGSNAFANAGISAINLPDAVTTIATRAFWNCTKLTSLTVPENVSSIGKEAFAVGNWLTQLTWNAKHCWSNGDITAANINKVIIGNTVEVLPINFVAHSKIATINIPASVTYIGSYAFIGCSSISNITIPKSVMNIGKDAFVDCTGLTKLTWKAKNCNTNGSMYTDNITEVTIGNDVETLPISFLRNSKITSINIPNSVKVIGGIAFSGCRDLANLSLPESIQVIGDFAFYGCSALTALTIPRSVISIGYYAFDYCDGLSSLTWNAINCTTNGDMTTYNLSQVNIGNEVKKLPIGLAANSQITSISIPNSVDSICYSAFTGCEGLLSVDIPNSVIHIGDDVFSYCKGLTDVTIPDQVTRIGDNAFTNCTNLMRITIGASVDSIGYGAFGHCTSLQKVISLPLTPPYMFDSFSGVPNDMTVYVLPDALEAYLSDYHWSRFNIQAADFNVSNLTVNLPDGIDVSKYTNMKLEIKCKDSNKERHLVIGKKASYTFGALDNNTSWNITLTNQYGDVFGTIENVEIGEQDVAVTFPSLKQPQTVSLMVKTPVGQEVTEQVNISWSDESGELLKQGKQIAGLPAGRKLAYSVKLPQELATAYSLPANMTYTVKEGSNSVLCQLTAIAQTQLIGKVKEASTNQPIYGATISAVQSFGGSNTKTLTTRTDNQGQYLLDASSVPTTLTVAAPGYISQTVDCDMTGGSNTITVPDVALSPITGVVVNVNLTYTPAHAEGDNVETQNWYSDYQNVDYEVYNMTAGHAVTDISVQYPRIVIMEEVNDGDVLELTAISRNDAFNSVRTTVTIVEQKAVATFNVKERGKIIASYKKNINSAVAGSLYRNANLERIGEYSNCSLSIENLDDGEYTLITMGEGESGLYNSIYSIDQLEGIGLEEGIDFVKSNVLVNDGIISKAIIDEVPFFDESKFDYYFDNKSFNVNKPDIVVGNFLTFRAQVDFKEQHKDKVNDVKVIVDLPESCQFYENSVMEGSNKGYYSIEGNRIIIPLANHNALVRFCAIPTEIGNFNPSASVQFSLNGKTITQPIGKANYHVESMSSLIVPPTTASTTISVGGTAYNNCQIDIYDNDVLIGHTTANANKKWLTHCELHQPYNLSRHSIYAIITTAEGIQMSTETSTCVYNKNEPQVSKVTQYNEQRGPTPYLVTWNFLNPSLSTQHYSYDMYDNHRTFTYTIEFTDNQAVDNVMLYVKTANGHWWPLEATYDSAKNVWVTAGEFGNSQNADLPVNVAVDFICTAPLWNIDSVSSINIIKNIYGDVTIEDFDEDESFVYFTLSPRRKELSLRNVFYRTGKENNNVFSIINNHFDNYIIDGSHSKYYTNSNSSLIITESQDSIYMFGVFDNNDSELFNAMIEVINGQYTNAPKRIWIPNFDADEIPEGDGAALDQWVNDLIRPAIDLANSKLKELCPEDQAQRDKIHYAIWHLRNCAIIRRAAVFTHFLQWASIAQPGQHPIERLFEAWQAVDGNTNFTETIDWLNEETMGKLQDIYDVYPTCPNDDGVPTGGAAPIDPMAFLYSDEYSDVVQYPGSDMTFCIDPSGFVYEGVPSNRLQGVTASCYYKETVEDMYGDEHENVVLWDAENYGQQNPLLTDENGYYRWDVPIGMWQVKYEKEGYETTYSDWLPVPPPQLDVNIGMVQMRQPEVIKARAYPKAVEFEFDKYMLPEDLTTQNITVLNDYGESVSGTIELLNAELDDPLAITSIRRAPGTGLTFASKVRFNSNSRFYQTATLKVRKAVKSYAGLEMSEDYVVTLPVEYEMEEIVADSTIIIPYGDSRELTVRVQPSYAASGKTLTVLPTSSIIATTDAEQYTLDNNGKAVIAVHGDLPGMTSLIYCIDGYDLTAGTIVNVMTESQMTVAAPTTSIASGSEVENGTAVYLRCSTPGATIYYTLDGSCPCDPTPARKVYDGNPIIINGSTTIKAMATAPDLYDSDVATFVYRVGSGIKGDVNNDGEVNIADVNAIIGIILGLVVDDDIIYRADVNGDTEINIADVNEIIRIILGTSRAQHYNVNCDDALHLNDVQLRPGEVRTLNVTLDNAERYSALQCDIVLPSGLTLVDVNCSNGRVSKTGVMNDSTTRAMFYSMNRHQFTSNGSPVITLTVRADATLLSDSQITLTNSVLADNHNKAWYIADCAARVNNSSGINDLTAIADRVWVDGHTLFIETSQDGIAQLTMINGVVRDISLKHGINQLQLERGIYIVVINGNSHKIAIK